MEIALSFVDRSATVWDVKRAIGAILHGEEFYNPEDPSARRVNFHVELNEGITGTRNDGTGKLTLPTQKDGARFLKMVYGHGKAIKVNGRKLGFRRTGNKVDRRLVTQLDITPYLPPELEEEREDKLAHLRPAFHIDKVQFGIFYRDPTDPPGSSRRFANEYELSHKDKGAGRIWIEYAHKLIRVQLGDPMLESTAYNIAINFYNIRRFAIGMDWGSHFICFELWTPPIFQREDFHRTLTGDEFRDNKRFRQRIHSLNPAHAVIAPYAHQLRVILHHENELHEFARLCQIAGLPRPFRATVEAERKLFFAVKEVEKIQRWLRSFEWSIAFQLEASFRNGLLTTPELWALREPIELLCGSEPHVAADILRLFVEILRNRTASQSPRQCLEQARTKRDKLIEKRPNAGTFLCHHVTVTPTRLLLEGPYVIQSNRVIRKYPDHQTNFIRVDFRDEDRLQYRWERDVDGKSLLDDRVGGILKNGLEIAGRHFEFLAYSNSALRTHSVWFVRELEYPIRPLINAHVIRSSLGDFSGVIRYPSKYAARIAQAFTATDPSVTIRRSQWEEVPDLGTDPYLFTDGIGTISPKLGDLIWDALCNDRDENYRKHIKPSAYQIRFLGYKGVVSIDHELEGIKMRLRPSMNKFSVPQEEEEADIEIAKAFERAGEAHLNRQLIMILEDRGVEKAHLVKLQDEAIKDIHTARDSLGNASQLLKAHALGRSYNLHYIIQGLRALGMGTDSENDIKHVLSDVFIDRLITFGMNSVLRDIKHKARIPIPNSYHLVGVADEGPAYEAEGKRNVFKLKEGEIFVCIHRQDEEPKILKGPVTISRSPTVHPGDVQRVRAIGEPPAGKLCSFRHLKNVVVLPSVDAKGRSLASCLGGGDLDGDEYQIIQESTLLPTKYSEPASYEGAGTRELNRPGESTIDDICDFVVEYINSDVLGLLSDLHLVIADQSKHGTFDAKCIELAQLCSQAVDYPKNGIPVQMDAAPSRLMPYKPDWKQADHKIVQNADYYQSTKALGELFRGVTLFDKPKPLAEDVKARIASLPPLSDSISEALKPFITQHLGDFVNKDEDITDLHNLFLGYVDELRYTCLAHSVSESPDSRLEEEEIVVGTILADCTQARYRNDLTYRMRLHSDMVVRSIRRKLYQPNLPTEPFDRGAARYGLSQAWLAWDYAMRNRASFGANSFALIALDVILDILERFGDIYTVRQSQEKVEVDVGDLEM
ncbi:RdRP-domain-containing protein [Cristinia sonorae]|uniref:RNA-dependent RNA polymerase n=1 Tax=Cristinia sonorae TaxID=1940300 RepID=A0A8K0XP28_9AGAR|nr:RdRP-domain-containing protein [Cristinia sonorae]